MTISLDLETIRRFLSEALEEKGPDYVYEAPYDEEADAVQDCKYLTYDANGTPTGPGCLIGHVLVKAGVPMEALASLEGKDLMGLVSEEIFSAPYAVIAGLRDAQSVQDSGGTWETAVQVFDATVERRPHSW